MFAAGRSDAFGAFVVRAMPSIKEREILPGRKE
jgi:hypothetical protein